MTPPARVQAVSAGGPAPAGRSSDRAARCADARGWPAESALEALRHAMTGPSELRERLPNRSWPCARQRAVEGVMGGRAGPHRPTEPCFPPKMGRRAEPASRSDRWPPWGWRPVERDERQRGSRSRRDDGNASEAGEGRPRPWGAEAASRSDRWPRWGHRADAAQTQPRSEARSKRRWGAGEHARGQRPL